MILICLQAVVLVFEQLRVEKSIKVTTNEHEKIDYSPNETQLINATKLSGRTDKGWGIGVLNAMSLPSYSKIKDSQIGETSKVLVQPFTNYNVAVIDKTLKNAAYCSKDQAVKNYMQNLEDSWQNRGTSLSLKMLYYVDYNKLKHRK